MRRQDREVMYACACIGPAPDSRPGECVCTTAIRKENERRREEKKWNEQNHQCSGSGYSHKPHGKCTGYTYDRT